MDFTHCMVCSLLGVGPALAIFFILRAKRSSRGRCAPFAFLRLKVEGWHYRRIWEDTRLIILLYRLARNPGLAAPKAVKPSPRPVPLDKEPMSHIPLCFHFSSGTQTVCVQLILKSAHLSYASISDFIPGAWQAMRSAFRQCRRVNLSGMCPIHTPCTPPGEGVPGRNGPESSCFPRSQN